MHFFIVSFYIKWCYMPFNRNILTKKTFYNKNFTIKAIKEQS